MDDDSWLLPAACCFPAADDGDGDVQLYRRHTLDLSPASGRRRSEILVANASPERRTSASSAALRLATTLVPNTFSRRRREATTGSAEAVDVIATSPSRAGRDVGDILRSLGRG